MHLGYSELSIQRSPAIRLEHFISSEEQQEAKDMNGPYEGSICEKPRFVWCWTRNKAIPAAQWAAELFDLHSDDAAIESYVNEGGACK